MISIQQKPYMFSQQFLSFAAREINRVCHIAEKDYQGI